MSGGPGADSALPSRFRVGLAATCSRTSPATPTASSALLEAAGAARSSPSTTAVSKAATPTSRRARPATGRPSSTTCGSSAAKLEDVFAAQHRWDLAMTNSQGESVPHADLPFRRLREVLVHHADLGDDGFTPADWPSDYVREELRRMEMQYNARQPMGVIRSARGGHCGRSAGAAVLAARARRSSKAWSQPASSSSRPERPRIQFRSGRPTCGFRTVGRPDLRMDRRPPRTGRSGVLALAGERRRCLGVRGRRRRR